MNEFEAILFPAAGNTSSGRKGIAYDWQSLMAAQGVAEIESRLAGMVLEPAE